MPKSKKAAKSFIGPLPQGVKRKARARKVKSSGAGPKNGNGAKTSQVKQAHVHHACSILDPFCPAARAAKRPDGQGGSSIGFTVRGHNTIATDATGAAMMTFVPGLGRYGSVSSTLAAGTWSANAAWSVLNGSDFINTNAGEVRIVSFGCIFRSIASATNCQGVVNMFTIPNPLVSYQLPALSSNYPETRMMPMTSGMETSWISKPVGSKAHTFRPYSEATTTMTDFDWSSLVVEISGGPVSTTIGLVEYVCNVELTLKTSGLSTTGLGGTVTKPRPANPVALQIQSKVHTSMDSFVTGGVSKIESAVKTAAADAFDAIGSFGLGLLGF